MRCRRSATGGPPASTRVRYSATGTTLFHRSSPTVEWAPQPNPAHAPSDQYLRLWRDARPGRARLEISVLLVPGRLQARHGVEIHVRRLVVGHAGPVAPVHLGGQGRLRVDLQQVDRRVLGRELGERADRHAEVRGRLPREPQHQVEADVVEAGPARGVERSARPGLVVDPAEARQFLVDERLHAEAQPVDAGLAVAGQPVERHRFRVGLERDLGARVHVERFAAGTDQCGNVGRGEQRRGASAEVDRVGRGRRPAGRRLEGQAGTDLPGKRRDVAAFEAGVSHAAGEGAVPAERGTEGDVQVEADGRWAGSRQCPLPARPPGQATSAFGSGRRSCARAVPPVRRGRPAGRPCSFHMSSRSSGPPLGGSCR